MSFFKSFVPALGLLTALLVSSANAQTGMRQYEGASAWDFNVSSGVLFAENTLFSGFLDEDFSQGVFDQKLQGAYHLSGDLAYQFASGVTLGGEFGWSPVKESRFPLGHSTDGERILAETQNIYLFSGTLGYSHRMGRYGVFGRAGVGGAVLSIDPGSGPAANLVTDDGNTLWQTPIAVGAKIPVGRRLTANVIARDNIIYSQSPIDDTAHNWYVGAGVSLIL